MTDEPELPAGGEAAQTNGAPEDQIGSRIALKRVGKGLNHDGLSKLTKLLDRPSNSGISRTTIRGYEVGIYKPGTRELRLLSQALQVSPTWLIFGALDDPASTADAIGLAHRPPETELQKALAAAHLMRSLDKVDRDVVYSVLHTIARHKHGENVYRAGLIPIVEVGALFDDVWHDIKEGGKFDQVQMNKLVEAYGPYFTAIAEKELGMKLSELVKK